MSFDQSLNLSRQHLVTQKSSVTSNGFDLRTEESSKASRKKSKKSVNEKSTKSKATYYDFTEVFVWGDDSSGQLGLYHQKLKKGVLDQKQFTLPKTCSFNILIQQVSCGEAHSAILTHQGHLYMMGSNVDGQLGIGDNCQDLLNRDCAGAPCLVDSLKDFRVTNVTCGKNFTFAITQAKLSDDFDAIDKQFIFAWGCNQFGQLGFEGTESVQLPKQVKYFEESQQHVTQISAGKEHTLFVTSQGSVLSAGHNNHGQLGQNESLLTVSQPLMIESLKEKEIVQVSAGNDHSLFLTIEGEIFACGSNKQSQLGIIEILDRVYEPIKLQYLQNYKITQIQANEHSSAISDQGELFLWGRGVFGEYKTPQKILTISNQVKSVSLGGSLGAAVDCKGLLWTWGYNQHGELGVGDNDPRIHPYPVLTLKGKVVTQVACGGQFIVALGSNIKKEIPNLKLKKEKDDLIYKKKESNQKKRKSSKESYGRQSSYGKKRTSSVKNLHRKDSIGSLSKIYGGKSSFDESPNPKHGRKLSNMLQKRHSKMSLHTTKNQDTQPKSKSKLRIKRSSSKPPFSGEDTTIIKSSKLNTSGFSVKKKNQLSFISHINPQSNQSPHSKQALSKPDFLDDISNDYTNDNSMNMGVMYIPSALQTQTNKEKLIKDLTLENRQLKAEQEIMKKEQRKLKCQMEQLEKQYEKQKNNQQHQQEIQMLYSELKKKELIIIDLKKKKNELKDKYKDQQGKCEQVQRQRDCAIAERDHLTGQISALQDEYKSLQLKLEESESKNQTYESEIQEFQEELLKLSDQSTKVEKNFLDKIHELSQKYSDTLKQLEDLQQKNQLDQNKIEDLTNTIKDNSYYVNALEKENAYLREEIEKAKYSKDKVEYGKFVQNLLPIRKKQTTVQDENSGYSKPEESHIRTPFKEQNDKTNIHTSSQKQLTQQTEDSNVSLNVVEKSTDTICNQPQMKSHQIQMTQCSEQSNQETDFNELRMSYNQKLLKSLEKRALTKYR